LILLAAALIPVMATAQETTTTVSLDAWHNGCVALRNYDGVWTDDWAYSGGDQYLPIGTWTTSVTLGDKIPYDHMVISVTLQLHGGMAYGQNTLAPKLSGTSLGTIGPTSLYYGAQGANCPVANATELLGWRWDFPMQRYDGGFPGYVSGGLNTFDVGWSTLFDQVHGGNGKLTLEKANLIITHKPVNVFFDVDGDFATHRSDDLPQWVPGSSLAANPAPPTATPLQVIRVHVLTPPRVKGTVQAEFVEVSRFPGKAMNYPLASSDISPDMYFDNYSVTKQVTIQSSSAEADTVLSLSVNDYAARGVLKLTIPNGTKTPYVIYKRLPISTGPAMLPDAGWYVQGDRINPIGIASPTEDIDTSPAGPSETGDGFGVFEEYRGFVVQGVHTRLDPSRRDLFVYADTPIEKSLLNWLPFDIHYIGSGESKTEDLGRKGLPGVIRETWPELNPNRDVTGGTAVPVAQQSGQHGLRLILTNGQDRSYPDFYDANGQRQPAWQLGILGVAWQRQQTCTNWVCGPGIARVDVDIADQGASATFPSLNGMSFVEIFQRGNYRGNLYVQGASAFASPPTVYLNDSGQPVPDCNVSQSPDCDVYVVPDKRVHMNLYQNGTFILHSRLTFSDDYYTQVSLDCTTQIRSVLSSADFAQLAKTVTLHEAVHGLGVPHNTVCGSVMYDAGGIQKMPNSLPLPTSLLQTELSAMRTH
jgi:hypothetical protein